MPLTAREVDTAKSDKDRMIGAGNGLYLEVMKSGLKRWWFRYKVQGKTRKMPLGYYPDVSLAKARELTAIHRSGLRDTDNPRDPLEARREEAEKAEQHRFAEELAQAAIAAEAAKQAARMTFNDLFMRWKKTQLHERKDGGAEIERAFTKDVLPKLGALYADEVNRQIIASVLHEIAERGAKRMANRTLSDLRQCFGFAIGAGLLENDPTSHLKKAAFGGKEVERDRILSYAELRHLLQQALPNCNLSHKAKSAVLVLISTATRVGELLRAKREHINLDTMEWTIPGENSKNEKPHIVHLSPFAAQSLQDLLTVMDHPVWLFPDRSGGSHVCVKTLTKQIGDRQTTSPMSGRSKVTHALELVGGRWTPHDLRRTAATIMGDLGVRPDVIEKCLNHTDENKVRKTYQRQTMIPERKDAFDRLGVRLSGLAHCGDTRTEADATPNNI